MKQIAIVLPSYLPVPAVKGGAVETLVQHIIDENEIHQNHIITVFSTYDKEARSLSQGYLFSRFIWIKRNTIYRCLNFIFRIIKKISINGLDHLDLTIIKQQLKKSEYDVVVVEGSTIQVKSLKRVIPKNKLYLHVHANIFTEQTDLNDLVVSSVSKIITVSSFVKNQILIYTKAKENDVIVLRNCVDLNLFNSRCENRDHIDIRERYSIEKDEIVIMFSGRIVENKGVKHLLEAFNNVSSSRKIKLLIIGSFGSNFGMNKTIKDSFYEELNKLVESNSSNIIFTGFIHNSLLPKYLNASDILVIPSLVEDAAPLTPIEGMALGKPIITTNAGGIPEYIDEKCAIILERDKHFVKNLTLSIEKLVHDNELRKEMGFAGKEKVKQFSSEIYYREFTHILTL